MKIAAYHHSIRGHGRRHRYLRNYGRGRRPSLVRSSFCSHLRFVNFKRSFLNTSTMCQNPSTHCIGERTLREEEKDTIKLKKSSGLGPSGESMDSPKYDNVDRSSVSTAVFIFSRACTLVVTCSTNG